MMKRIFTSNNNYNYLLYSSSSSNKRTAVAVLKRNSSAVAVNANNANEAMFCNQCEQTRDNVGCKTIGVCGKTPETAALQDNLVYALKGLAALREAAGTVDKEIDAFVLRSLFSTMTNVNFDSERFRELLQQTQGYVNQTKKQISSPALPKSDHSKWSMKGNSVEELSNQGKQLRVHDKPSVDKDIVGMQELITYGLKGMCAYAEHARVLGKTNDDVYKFVNSTLAKLTDDKKSLPELIQLALDVGKMNVTVLDMLDAGHNSNFGTPSPRKVKTLPRVGKHAILVSGHDIKDLEHVLKESEGKNIDVYTHGELLPAHSYPKIAKYPHLAGHFGGPWQLQKFEFSEFPGAILMTTNCLIEPRKMYKNRLFTNSVVGWPGVDHIKDEDFKPLINKALSLPGFTNDDVHDLENETALYPDLNVGFGHSAVLGMADKILDAIKRGDISRFIVMGGCDGSESERSYYTAMAKKLPLDTVILTLGCGKYRFNKLDLGTIPSLGIPRVVDLGQCNDAYSGVRIALGLANALNIKDLNQLPINFVVSWFEQKAVAVFLTLLHLGIKNIYLGPTLPAFATPNILNFLVQNYNVHPISTVEKDMKTMNLNPRE